MRDQHQHEEETSNDDRADTALQEGSHLESAQVADPEQTSDQSDKSEPQATNAGDPPQQQKKTIHF